MRKFGCLLVLIVTAAPAAYAPASPSDITPEGQKLAKVLDGMDVEHLWLPGEVVDFDTGKKIREAKSRVTHCSAFTAVVCGKLGVYLLRPPEHEAKLLANAQSDWLAGEKAAKQGWKEVKGAAKAQQLANEGQLVVVVFREKDDARPGHVAIVRPSTRNDDQIKETGPQVIQAGATNSSSISVKEGFKNHKGAWPDGVRYFAHAIDWPALGKEPKHLEAARDLVKNLDLKDTSYEHGKPDVSFTAPYRSHTDCSGFIGTLLQYAYGYTPAQLKKWFGQERPTADQFHDTIADGRGFEQIKDFRQVQPGDILAVKYKQPKEKSNGHVMLVAGAPKPMASEDPLKAGLEQWEVPVIDSAKSGHGPTDTRHVEGEKHHEGLGQGVLRVFVDKDGGVAGYTWSVGGKSYLDQEEHHMVVGRLK
jgi:hypothetical protein